MNGTLQIQVDNSQNLQKGNYCKPTSFRVRVIFAYFEIKKKSRK